MLDEMLVRGLVYRLPVVLGLAMLAWVLFKRLPARETKALVTETPAPSGETKAPMPETKAPVGETKHALNLPMPCVVRSVGEHTMDLMSLN